MNNFMDALKNEANVKRTENGGIALSSTLGSLYDLFALGGSYRARSEDDCILLFKKAFEENEEYSLKCLFYLRDIIGGQGERRFFRACFHWLACAYTEAARRNLHMLATDMCRWDDIYCLVGTPLEKEALDMMKRQLFSDLRSEDNVSLAAKWAASLNCSSPKTKFFAKKTMEAMGVSPRVYRLILSTLRARIRVLERLMSENKWPEIDFAKIPSRAGLIYRKAFERHEPERYAEFAKSKNTKVNAKTLYPYDVVHKAIELIRSGYYTCVLEHPDATEREIINKYWEGLTNYFNGAALNALVVCDTSASMTWSGNTIQPIEIAVSLAMYAAEHNSGPFANHYISFSREAKLVEIKGVDFCDKVKRIVSSNVCENTNLESVFNLIERTIVNNNIPKEDVPQSLIIVTDGEIDEMRTNNESRLQLTMDRIREQWNAFVGYKFPNIVFWNAKGNDTFLMKPELGVTFVSGASPVLFESILMGKTGKNLMMETLNGERYVPIH